MDGIAMVTNRIRSERDRGAILVLVLVLTVVLSLVILALATYAIAGATSSDVTTGRTETNNSASAAIVWTLEELAAKRLRPDADCATDGATVAVPTGIAPSQAVVVTCGPHPEVGNHPAVVVTATSTRVDGAVRRIDTVVQVPRTQYTAQIAIWDAE